MEADMVHQTAVGRLAPSPTGALHLGNARSFLLAWLSARRQNGQVILRIEDLDSPRVKPWSLASTIDDLQWLGLDWDTGPTSKDSLSGDSAHLQSSRLARYHEVFAALQNSGRIYPCTCSRKDVEEALSAPHDLSAAEGLTALEGPIYPRTCFRRFQNKLPPQDTGRIAYRWHFEEDQIEWRDDLLGQQKCSPAKQLGDFVLARGDRTPAYQLAVVVDDYDMGVTEVIRGDDLVASTFRQISLLQALGWPGPKYTHLPLMVGSDGRRLAKRHGDTRLGYFRQLGITPEAIVGYLAWSCGLLPEPIRISPAQLIPHLDWTKIRRQNTIFNHEKGIRELQELSSG